MKNGIALAGHWILDTIKFIDNFPERSGICSIIKHHTSNGGGPFNNIVDLTNLKAPFPLIGIGCIGNDELGQQILTICKEKNINTSFLQTLKNEKTSFTDVMTVLETGERTMFHYHGASDKFSIENVPFQTLKKRKIKLFYLGHLLLMKTLEQKDTAYKLQAARLLHEAQQNGMETVVDIATVKNESRYQKIVLPCLPYIDHLSINELEAQKIVGLPIRTKRGLHCRHMKRAAKFLLDRGVRKNVIFHMPEGALWTSHNRKSIWHPSFRLPKRIIGACGAGDAFCSGVLVGLHESWPIQKTLQLANAAAAFTMMTDRNSDGIPPIDQAFEMIKNWKLNGKITR